MNKKLYVLLSAAAVPLAGLLVAIGLFSNDPQVVNGQIVEVGKETTRYISAGSELPKGVSLYYSDTPEAEIEQTPDGAFRYGNRELLVQPERNVTERQAKELAKAYDAELAGFLSLTGTCQWRLNRAYRYEELEALGHPAGHRDGRQQRRENVLPSRSAYRLRELIRIFGSGGRYPGGKYRRCSDDGAAAAGLCRLPGRLPLKRRLRKNQQKTSRRQPHRDVFCICCAVLS